MNRRTVYFPHSLPVFAFLLLVLVLVTVLIFLGAIGVAFREVGFSTATTAFILAATLLGSHINIPVAKLKATEPIVRVEYVRFFGIVYRVPQVEYDETTTMVAINVGGALIPLTVSFYLLWKMPSAISYALLGVAIVAAVTRFVARPVKGVGIVTPAFIPPLAAALSAYLLPSHAPQIVAYVAGVLGSLIGADLSNLHVIPQLGAPVASIGGAGTFDGVFWSGIIAVLLA
jgi:uncharacterized membrane protein